MTSGMNPENRFRTVGVLALAGLVSDAVYGGSPLAPGAHAAPQPPATSVAPPSASGSETAVHNPARR